MNKKKLKLKSVKEIKESMQEGKKKRKKKKEKHIGQFLLMGLITLGIVCASVVIAFSLYIVFTAPEFTQESLYFKEASVIEWKDGSELIRLGNENRVLKNYEDLPQILVDALVATEDSRFFQHSGFDAARFLKASLGQLAGNSGAGGASTISMQLAKNYFNGLESDGIDGIIRKFKDIYMAVFKIEKNYTKEQIIEMYFNTGWFAGGGSNYKSIEGVEQASHYYFGKSVSDLSLPECALIVGMYNNPTLYNPYWYPEYANDRKNTVLSLMYRHGYITEQEMLDAQQIHVASLVIEQQNVSASFAYQVIADYVRNDIKEKENIDIYTGGYRVRTTFDKGIQDIINNVQNGGAYTFKDDLMQVAIAVTSVEDGSITAIGPGRNYVPQGDNRATFRQQPGSTIKPIIDYAPLIEYNNASTGQMFMDFRYPYNNGTYINNWDNSFKGNMLLKDALSQSRNVTALQAYHQVDKNQIKEFLKNLSIDEKNYGDDLYESYSVGGFPYGLTPLESSAAYGAFARGGYFIEPYSYTSITNMETEETIEYKYEKTRAMSEETAYMITDVLLQATREGVGGSINSNLRGSIASKSGTSNMSSDDAAKIGVPATTTPDHWVNTYNPDYAISMWLGYDRKDLDKNHYLTTPTGSGPRGQISAYLANNILTSNKKFEKPSTVTSVVVERNTLPTKRASEYTPDNMKYSALFKAGTEPSETSNRYQKLEDAKNGKSSVSDKTITLSWENAPTPKALDTSAIRTDFANYFATFKKNYSRSYASFENEYMRIYESSLTSTLGSFGYQVYLKDANDNLTSLGWTQNNTFNYTAPTGGEYTFIIKSAYNLFKTNQSNGITIKAKVDAPTINLTVTPQSVCLEKGKTFDPKTGVKVTLDGKDITSSCTIIASSIDSSTTGSKEVTYTITYQNETKKINGKVNVSDKCETQPVINPDPKPEDPE